MKYDVGIVERYRFTSGSSEWISDSVDRQLVDSIKALYAIVLKKPYPLTSMQSENLIKESRTEELWRTLVYNRTVEGLIAPSHWSQVFQTILDGPSSVPFDFIHPPHTQTLSQAEVAQSYVDPYLAAVKTCLETGRWLYITRNGRLGIANRTVRVNDIVCVLAGCSSPVVIRPKRGLFGKNSGLATLRGSTYLHDYMRGEAIVDLDLGVLSLETFQL